MLGFSETQSRTLHLTWIAFFLTFVAWFNMAPFNTTIMYQLGLKEAEINILMICFKWYINFCHAEPEIFLFL